MAPFDIEWNFDTHDGEAADRTNSATSLALQRPEAESPEGQSAFDNLTPRVESTSRVERRTAPRSDGAIGCRLCGELVMLDPDTIRLTVGYAAVACHACRSEVRVRRADAYRDVDAAIAWTFACYADDEPEPTYVPPVPRRRLLKRA